MKNVGLIIGLCIIFLIILIVLIAILILAYCYKRLLSSNTHKISKHSIDDDDSLGSQDITHIQANEDVQSLENISVEIHRDNNGVNNKKINKDDILSDSGKLQPDVDDTFDEHGRKENDDSKHEYTTTCIKYYVIAQESDDYNFTLKKVTLFSPVEMTEDFYLSNSQVNMTIQIPKQCVVENNNQYVCFTQMVMNTELKDEEKIKYDRIQLDHNTISGPIDQWCDFMNHISISNYIFKSDTVINEKSEDIKTCFMRIENLFSAMIIVMLKRIQVKHALMDTLNDSHNYDLLKQDIHLLLRIITVSFGDNKDILQFISSALLNKINIALGIGEDSNLDNALKKCVDFIKNDHNFQKELQKDLGIDLCCENINTTVDNPDEKENQRENSADDTSQENSIDLWVEIDPKENDNIFNTLYLVSSQQLCTLQINLEIDITASKAQAKEIKKVKCITLHQGKNRLVSEVICDDMSLEDYLTTCKILKIFTRNNQDRYERDELFREDFCNALLYEENSNHVPKLVLNHDLLTLTKLLKDICYQGYNKLSIMFKDIMSVQGAMHALSGENIMDCFALKNKQLWENGQWKILYTQYKESYDQVMGHMHVLSVQDIDKKIKIFSDLLHNEDAWANMRKLIPMVTRLALLNFSSVLNEDSYTEIKSFICLIKDLGINLNESKIEDSVEAFIDKRKIVIQGYLKILCNRKQYLEKCKTKKNLLCNDNTCSPNWHSIFHGWFSHWYNRFNMFDIRHNPALDNSMMPFGVNLEWIPDYLRDDTTGDKNNNAQELFFLNEINTIQKCKNNNDKIYKKIYKACNLESNNKTRNNVRDDKDKKSKIPIVMDGMLEKQRALLSTPRSFNGIMKYIIQDQYWGKFFATLFSDCLDKQYVCSQDKKKLLAKIAKITAFQFACNAMCNEKSLILYCKHQGISLVSNAATDVSAFQGYVKLKSTLRYMQYSNFQRLCLLSSQAISSVNAYHNTSDETPSVNVVYSKQMITINSVNIKHIKLSLQGICNEEQVFLQLYTVLSLLETNQGISITGESNITRETIISSIISIYEKSIISLYDEIYHTSQEISRVIKNIQKSSPSYEVYNQLIRAVEKYDVMFSVLQKIIIISFLCFSDISPFV